MQIIQSLKALCTQVVLMLILVFTTNYVCASNNNYLLQETFIDSTNDSGLISSKPEKSSKEEKKEKKEEGKKMLKDNHERFLIKYDYIFANLKTRVTFTGPNGILNLSLGMEENLGLPSRASFSSLEFVYRITKRSGFYANYYGINRNISYVSENDVPFLGDTISAGSSVSTFFNTQMFSAGYLFSALTTPDVYLGFYVNLYVIYLNTGFKTINETNGTELAIFMPLPNIGFVGSFKLTNWLLFYGSIGVFSLNTDQFGGMIYSFSLSLGFKPTNWLAINVSYKEFDISVYDNIKRQIDATVEYNFKGPSVGLTFQF